MPFSQRNIFYLRTSAHVVLQTILYLDPRDVKWMNSHAHIDDADEQAENDDDDDDDDDHMYERNHSTGDLVWSRALARLKHKIMPKLVAESIDGQLLSSTNKKEKVDTHIEPDFQMAYFFRKVGGKHAVLLKEKELKFPEPHTNNAAAVATSATTTAAPSNAMLPPILPASAMKRSNARDAMPESRLAARQYNQTDNVMTEGTRIATEDGTLEQGEEEEEEEEEEDVKPGKRKRGQNELDDDGTEGFSMSMSSFSQPQPIRVKEEEETDLQMPDAMADPIMAEPIDLDAIQDDKKPRLHVNYSGFKIFGKTFIVVIEPTKRTKRLRPSLFQTAAPKERHQLSSTPVPRQVRETPERGASLSSRRSSSLARSEVEEDEEDVEEERMDSRRGNRYNTGLFRGTSSDWTPTPTPEPERRKAPPYEIAMTESATDDADNTHNEEQGYTDDSTSMMLATQMLQGGIAGQGNDIDDD
ncbi:hypothetical protein CBS101457_001725 [Exobasidium rhododendri]|nr:hypothetical protein CBS101457_001725 [Exobasidium rhododendri]